MPTGYTADVADGKVTDFPTFAMQCARAFGACIEMRDDDKDAVIPDEFKPSDYHLKRLAEADKELAVFKARKNPDWIAATDHHNAAEMREHKEAVERNQSVAFNYSTMLSQAEAWEPPSADHEGLKGFMVDQLKSSIKFDCRTPEAPKPLTVGEFMEAERARIAWDIDYHTRQHAEEVERAKSRTLWVRQLRESLAAITA